MYDIEKILKRIPDMGSRIMNRHIYIWGTGNSALMYREGLNREKSLHIYGYAVNDEKRWGENFLGTRIYSPEDVATDEKAIVLICTLQPWVYEEVSTQLNSLNIENYFIDEMIFGLHKQELVNVFDGLYDDRSKEIYLNMLESRMICKYPNEGVTSFNPNHINAAFSRIDEKDVFVDCGAFVGDSIERYIWDHYGTFKKIYGFEPDAENFAAMTTRVERLRKEWNINDDAIEILPCGISDTSSTMYIHKSSDGGLGSSVVEKGGLDSEKCDIVSIDDFFYKNNIPFSFLKADVEGYEFKLIEGARKSIVAYEPRLAICIYHNATDFYSIPLRIREINEKYKIMIRHHSVQFFDTVCYAWI